MRARIRREWLQKHPTPRAGDGDFHWFPAAADPALLSAIAAGAAADLTLWLEPGRVVCARRFTAVAPGDGRRYVGISAAISEHPGASAAALLAATPIPEPSPWNAAPTDPIDVAISEPAPRSHGSATPALIAATWLGAASPELVPVTTVAAIETWLPDEVRARARRIVLGAPADESPAADAARWLAVALAAHGPALERARRAWSAVLAAPTPPLELMTELAVLERAWSTADSLRAHLDLPLPPRAITGGDGDAQWSRILHAWGRGWLAPHHTARLAHLLGRRALADQLASIDRDRSTRWRRTLRLSSLLPRSAADTLEREATGG